MLNCRNGHQPIRAHAKLRTGGEERRREGRRGEGKYEGGGGGGEEERLRQKEGKGRGWQRKCREVKKIKEREKVRKRERGEEKETWALMGQKHFKYALVDRKKWIKKRNNTHTLPLNKNIWQLRGRVGRGLGWWGRSVASFVTWRRQNWSKRDSLKVSSQSPYLLPLRGPRWGSGGKKKRKKRHICVCCDLSVCQLACVWSVCVHLRVIYIYIERDVCASECVCVQICKSGRSCKGMCLCVSLCVCVQMCLVNMCDCLQASAIFKSMIRPIHRPVPSLKKKKKN